MSNENENRIGSGSPLEKPIKINRDFEDKMSATITAEIDGNSLTEKDFTITSQTSEEIELTLSEALRVIGATVKFLNQTKDEGRHEIRTIKDKENQKKLNQIRDELVESGFNNKTAIQAFDRIKVIVSSKEGTPQVYEQKSE